MTEHESLHVSAIGVTNPVAAGPALLPPPEWAIVVDVRRNDRQAEPHLSAAAFSVQKILIHGVETPTVCSVIIDEVTEPAPGIYVLQVDWPDTGRDGGTVACIVEARSGPAMGRALIRLES